MQQHYRNYAQQAPQRSPHAQNRRGGIGPMMSGNQHAAGQLSQAQMAQQQQAQIQSNELAKRRSRKPTDRAIPDGVDQNIVNPDAVQRYKELRNIERLLDSTITRKRLDVLESAQRSSKQYKTLRVWISNTVEDQAWQGSGLNVDAFDFTPATEASYRVKIQGKLLDEEEDKSIDAGGQAAHAARDTEQGDSDKMQEDEQEAESAAKSEGLTSKFSQFFRSISVEFDKSRFRNGTEQAVEWKKADGAPRAAGAPQAAEFDEFTFKRNGDENVNITVNLVRQEMPEKYRLTPELADVVDMTEATQQEAVMALWEYIRASGLQEDEEKRNFRCDESLRKIVGRGDIGYVPMLNEYVTAHLRPLPPVSLPYTIRVDEEFHKSPEPTIYDIQVAVEDSWRNTLQQTLNNPQYASMLKDITSLDDQLARIVQAVSVSKARHSFLNTLSENPATFVNSWLSSQKRDLEVILGESPNGETITGDEWHRGGSSSVWATQNARESVNVLLSRQR